MSEEAKAAPAAKGGSMMKKIIMIVGALVVVGGAAGGTYWWMHRGQTVVAAAEPEPASRGLLPFEPFVVNLADGSGSHFLRANIQLVLEGAEKAEELTKTPVIVMQARSAILELLSQQSAAALVTPAGKQALKLAIAERATKALGEHEQKVLDVLFSEFVVQF